MKTEDKRVLVFCGEIDINPYCQVAFRGMNISCHECRRRHLWEKFWKQDKRLGVGVAIK